MLSGEMGNVVSNQSDLLNFVLRVLSYPSGRTENLGTRF